MFREQFLIPFRIDFWLRKSGISYCYGGCLIVDALGMNRFYLCLTTLFLSVAVHNVAADAPTYAAPFYVNCESASYERVDVAHRLGGELGFLAGRELEKIRIISAQFGDEQLIAASNVVAMGRAEFGMKSELLYGVLIKSVFEIRDHRRFCDVVETGIELALYSGDIHISNVKFVIDDDFDYSGQYVVVQPASDDDRETVIDLIGRKYFESLKECFSNHFDRFLKWQSQSEKSVSSSTAQNNIEKIKEYFAFYEDEQLYHFVIPNDVSDFFLSDVPFNIEFSRFGREMSWKGRARTVCLREAAEGILGLSLWFCTG